MPAIGCFLKIDLEYPKELRELHNDYPLAPDKIEIKIEILPNYQLKIAEFYNIPIGNVKRLVPNLFNVLHYEILQLYRRLGLKLHHVLDFSQSQWFKSYIEFNRGWKSGWKSGWKNVVQINEQCCVW